MQLSLFSIKLRRLLGPGGAEPAAVPPVTRQSWVSTPSMLAGKRPHLSPLTPPPTSLADLRSELQATGLKCAVVAAYVDLGRHRRPAEVPLLEMQIAYVESLLPPRGVARGQVRPRLHRV